MAAMQLKFIPRVSKLVSAQVVRIIWANQIAATSEWQDGDKMITKFQGEFPMVVKFQSMVSIANENSSRSDDESDKQASCKIFGRWSCWISRLVLKFL